jgi:signal transduction histidine kinase
MRNHVAAAFSLLAALALAPLFASGAESDDRAAPRDAERIVHGAVRRIEKVGKEKAFAAFNSPEGSFTYRDLYVTVYDFSGRCLAHGADKSRIGKVLIDDVDEDGRLFIRERVAKAKAEGKGWQEYKWMNPLTKKVEEKIAYFEVVQGVIVACGAYKPKS